MQSALCQTHTNLSLTGPLFSCWLQVAKTCLEVVKVNPGIVEVVAGGYPPNAGMKDWRAVGIDVVGVLKQLTTHP